MKTRGTKFLSFLLMIGVAIMMLTPTKGFAGSASDASAHVHATITTNNDTYESGTSAIVSVKYTLDQNSIHAGDYVIVTIPSDIASSVNFSLNSQHFSSSEDLGNGQYKLTFASDIESGLSGSFNAYVTTKTVDKTTEGTITVGDDSKKITVVPSGSPSGIGTYTDTIMKDAAENSGVSFGGYDYSDRYGDGAAQIGVADLTNGGTFKYRLFINDKKGTISNVTVIDRIPDGMTFNHGKAIEVTDQATGKETDLTSYSIELEGQTLIFKYPGTFSNTIQINYWVDIPVGSNTSKYTNTATITYTQNGDVRQEHRNYVLQGTDNNASNGEKSVDKSIISTDPDDQFVTYTIKFWNSNGFAAGEINLNDVLDSHVKFVNADRNDYFSTIQDSTDPQKILITNTKAIDGSTASYVRFMVDMTDVPVGYTVKNSVGGNTTKTTKYDGGLTLSASKLVNGETNGIKEGQFSFQLLSESGDALQTKTNDADGKISFDRIPYTFDDVGKTYVYQVKEVAGKDKTYEYDSSVYTVTVTPSLETDSSGNPTGKILADQVITCGDKTVNSIVFNNTIATGSLKLTKTSNGHDTPADAEFTITGPNSYSRTVKYSELTDGSITISDLPVGTYTVTESNVNVDGYTLTVSGSTTAEVTKGETAEITLTNTYTQDTGNLKLTKTSAGHDTPDDAEFSITGSNNYSRTVKYSELTDGSITISDLPVGTYTVTESNVNVDGYTLTVSGSTTAEVTKGETAEITLTNTYAQDTGSLKLTKTSAGHDTPADAEFTITGPDSYGKTVKYSELTDGSITISGLSVGAYTVTESNANVEGYTLTVTGDTTIEIAKDNTAEIALTNTYTPNEVTPSTGSLKLTKISNGHDTPGDAEFTITGPDNYGKTVKYSELTDGSITISGLSVGAYTVTESKADIAGYTLTVTGGTTAEVTKYSTADISLTNTYTPNEVTPSIGSLKLTKISNGHDTPGDAEFTITGPYGYSKTIKYSDLKDGSITLNGLVTGNYNVKESKADVDGYTLSVDGNTTAEVAGGSTAEIKLTNTYTPNTEIPDTGSLKLIKVSEGHDTPADAEFTITGPDNYVKTVKYSDLKDGTIILNDLPVGTYTVAESGADVKGYTLKFDGSTTAEVVKDDVTEITLTNTYLSDKVPSTSVKDSKPKGNTPETGTGSNLMTWFIILVVSAAMAVVFVQRDKHNSRQQ
jgi:pilin isopeptide linkage protein